jgi:hypothetical protein
MNFLEVNNKKFNTHELVEALKKLGIDKSDHICVHSEIFTLGKPLLPKEEFLSAILQSFLEVIGENGVLIMPTFTYSFCNGECYDKRNSISKMGALTEYFRHMQGVIRTNDPIFSFAIHGDKTSEYAKNTTSCFGDNCVYDVLVRNNGKIISFGSGKLWYTFAHYVEEKAQVSYRYFKDFSGIFIDENGVSKQTTQRYYVRDLEQKSILPREKQVELLKKSNNYKIVEFAFKDIISVNSKKYLDELMKTFKNNEKLLLED